MVPMFVLCTGNAELCNKLFKSMKGVSTDDDTLVRIILSLSEVVIIIKKNTYPGFDIELHFYMNLIDYDKSILTY